jgi:hypothetical protein
MDHRLSNRICPLGIVNTKIEIHDSRVAEITNRNSTVIVHFLPAYLHKSEGRAGIDSGTGWVQEVLMIFPEASINGSFPNWPCDIMDGELFISGERHANSIPVPLQVTGLTELRLICDSNHTVTVTGRGLKLELVGEPRYVEDFEPIKLTNQDEHP